MSRVAPGDAAVAVALIAVVVVRCVRHLALWVLVVSLAHFAGERPTGCSAAAVAVQRRRSVPGGAVRPTWALPVRAAFVRVSVADRLRRVDVARRTGMAVSALGPGIAGLGLERSGTGRSLPAGSLVLLGKSRVLRTIAIVIGISWISGSRTTYPY